MGTLTALVLATPIFGFALTPPASISDAVPSAALVDALPAQLSVAAEAGGTSGEPADAPLSGDEFKAQLRKRAKLAKVHKNLGIATWAAMTWAMASGTVQYRNLYAGGSLGQTPCVTGDAWPRQKGCSGTPLPHLLTGVVTAALYTTTLGLSFAMPDPDHASEGDSKFARRLRTHKVLRWIHLGGMILQMVLGPIIANSEGLGLDRANDFKKLKALAAVHLASGYVTWGALTAAGSIMLW